MFRKIIAMLMMSLMLVGSAALAQADTEADTETIVDYRHGVMTSLKGHLSATASILFDGYEVPEGHLAVHAAAMVGVTNDLPALFPEGSVNEESAALPAVWEQWEKFGEAADANHTAAQAYARAVSGGADAQELAGLFEELLDTCGGCHDDFREEHDH